MIIEEQWFQAAKEGDLPTLKQNIQKFKSKHNANNYECTALIYAAINGQTESVAFLSRFEARLTNKNKETALIWAAFKGKTECIPFLMSEKIMQDEDGQTALYKACRWNYVECAKYLLSETGFTDSDGKTPLQIAQERGRNEIIQIIENFMKDKMFRVCDKSDWFIAVRAGYIDSVKKYYQQYKSERTDKGESALQLAAYYNNRECVEYLAQFELRLVDQEGRTALMRAASRDCFECIPLLISELKIQDNKSNCALHYACENDCPQSALLLLDESNIKNKDGKTALQIAIDINAEECRIILEIQQRFVQNTLIQDDWFISARYGNLSAVKQVVSLFKGKKNSSNQTALRIAVVNNQQKIVEFLSQYECGSQDNDGKTALMHSVCNKKPEFIPFLQRELKMKDMQGKTALVYGCENNNISYAAMLLNEYDIQNNNGKTPLQVCEENGFKECAKIIKEYSKSKLLIVNSEDDWFTAATFGYINSIKQYSKKYKQQRNSKGETALMLSAQFQHFDCCEYLAQFEIGLVDQEGKTALIHATKNNSFQCITPLQKEMKDRDKKGMTALHHACSNNFFECAKYLLDEVDIQNNDDKTPIENAREKGSSECVKIIENYVNTKLWFEAVEKENLNIIQQQISKYQKSQNQFGMTALMISITHKNQKLVEFLCQCETGMIDDNGKSALIYASINNVHAFIPLLTKELKMKDNEGKTALFYACQNGFVECAKLLLQESGISDNIKVTPLMLAKQQNNQQLVTLLQDYESKMFSQTVVENEQINQQHKIDVRENEDLKLKNVKQKQEIEDLQKKIVDMQKQMILLNSKVIQVMKKGGQ